MQAVYEFAEKYKSVKSKPLAITVPLQVQLDLMFLIKYHMKKQGNSFEITLCFFVLCKN
jgi:hypothetical protein